MLIHRRNYCIENELILATLISVVPLRKRGTSGGAIDETNEVIPNQDGVYLNSGTNEFCGMLGVRAIILAVSLVTATKVAMRLAMQLIGLELGFEVAEDMVIGIKMCYEANGFL